jgi:hypothetical protein
MCARVRELAPNCHRGRLLLALSSCGDPPKARGAFGVRWTATDGRSGSGTFAIAKDKGPDSARSSLRPGRSGSSSGSDRSPVRFLFASVGDSGSSP